MKGDYHEDGFRALRQPSPPSFGAWLDASSGLPGKADLKWGQQYPWPTRGRNRHLQPEDALRHDRLLEGHQGERDHPNGRAGHEGISCLDLHG